MVRRQDTRYRPVYPALVNFLYDLPPEGNGVWYWLSCSSLNLQVSKPELARHLAFTTTLISQAIDHFKFAVNRSDSRVTHPFKSPCQVRVHEFHRVGGALPPSSTLWNEVVIAPGTRPNTTYCLYFCFRSAFTVCACDRYEKAHQKGTCD